MTPTPPLPSVHIAIMQPVGYVPSLGLVDPARFIRYQLRRFGVEVSISKNRLRGDAVNIVLGAHLGFPAESRERHACLFLNLEQLGSQGAQLPDAYLDLLRTSAVVDYDPANLSAYGGNPREVPLIPFRHAPYLEAAVSATTPLEDRPIDLLFIGSMNDRRRRIIDRVEACGLQVAIFDHPLFGEERDHYVRQAKAVLNCHYYESKKFEQVRAFHCLSLGTPVISERSVVTHVDPVFNDVITWFDESSLESFFSHGFGTSAFFEHARHQLEKWRACDPVEDYADLMAFAAGYMRGHAQHRPRDAWRPHRINLGSGKDYKPGWLNIDVSERAEPDLVVDLGRQQELPVCGITRFGLDVHLERGSVQKIHANNVLEHVPDLPCLMGNALALLADGGEMEIEVPFERALTAWQDPTHVRAMNENSWVYYTDWFWYLGWYEDRFSMTQSAFLDDRLAPCARDRAAFMRVTLTKVKTTPHERMIAQTLQAQFQLPDDDCTVQDVRTERVTVQGLPEVIESARVAA